MSNQHNTSISFVEALTSYIKFIERFNLVDTLDAVEGFNLMIQAKLIRIHNLNIEGTPIHHLFNELHAATITYQGKLIEMIKPNNAYSDRLVEMLRLLKNINHDDAYKDI